MRSTWTSLGVALLVGTLGFAGCSSNEPASDEGPPPEEYYGEDGETMGGEPYATEGEGYGETGESGMEASAATDPNTIWVLVEWQGEGDAKTPIIQVKDAHQAEATFESASDELIASLKERKAAIADAGGAPVVKISAPTDVDFDQVVKPIMLASFRAGFGTASVQYEARVAD